MKITTKFNSKCTSCGGVIAAGDQCEWERGAGVSHIGKCPSPFSNPTDVRNGADHIMGGGNGNGNGVHVTTSAAPITATAGVYRKDGRVYVVKLNREKTRSYAKEIVPSPPRMTEAGEVYDFEAVYRAGMIYRLEESDRWPLADATTFLTRYSRCIVCGRHLKAATSVAKSIGPVCSKYFA